MRVLVTGASGMIGSAVCDALLARGDEVVGLSRDPERARKANPTVNWHAWNPTEERPLEAAFEGVDGVINLIGENINQRLTPEAKQRIRDSRVRATKNLIDGLAAAPTKPKVLVSPSAVGYYGDHGEAMIDEGTSKGEGFLSDLPAEWEAAAGAAEELGVRVAIFRGAPVLDPSGGLIKQILLPFKFGVGGPLAGGKQYMPVIHRDDVAGLFLWALDNEAVTGTLNASLPDPITNREFTKALGSVLHRPAVAPVPRFVIAAILGRELADGALWSQRVIPRRALDLGYAFRFPEIEPALRDLLRR
jgi:uncharacterized protein (TIGR01777 family)